MVCRFKHLTRKYIQMKCNGNIVQHTHAKNAAVRYSIIKKQTILLLFYRLRIVVMYIILTKTCKIQHP